MKIAFDYQMFTHQSYGGISRYYTTLANELSRQDQDVGVFAGIHQNHYVQELPSFVLHGARLTKYPPKTGQAFLWLNHIISQMWMKHWKPDLIHETYYSSLPTFKTNAVRVTSVYDMIHEIFKDQFSKQDKTTQYKRETFDRVDHIISISESTKRDLIDLFGIDESKISVVHLGVNSSIFKNSQVNYTIAIDKPYLLYVGGRGGYKNFTGFLKAYASSTILKKHFQIIAFGGGQFNTTELSLIYELKLTKSHIYQISGSDEILTKLYSKASAFIYPSLYEGFGLPPLEAMAAGCPVVTSNTSSMPEVVNNAGEYFDPKSIDDMRNAIERVVGCEVLRKSLVNAGFNNIKNFSWQKCARETLSIYQQLTGKL